MTLAGIARILGDCPNVAEIRYSVPSGRGYWTVYPSESGGGRVHCNVTEVVDLYTIRGTRHNLYHLPSWPDWTFTCDIDLKVRLDKGNYLGEDGQYPVKAWLMDVEHLDANIHRLSGRLLEIGLDELGTICASRGKQGKKRIESLEWDQLKPYTVDELSRFGQNAKGLKRLSLGRHNQMGSTLTTRDLAGIVTVIRAEFPDLTHLSIALKACDTSGAIIPEMAIPIADLPWDGHLEVVEMIITDDAFADYSFGFPAFAVARNFACLGGSACRYSVFHKDVFGFGMSIFGEGDQENEVQEVVEWFKA